MKEYGLVGGHRLDRETIALNWLLRLGVLACFVGHGVIGIQGKADWLPLFAVTGIPAPVAWKLMPGVGAMDILLGVVCFFRPTRVLLVWATIWCAWTALVRPLAGMSAFEVVERAGNYGIPLVLLLSTRAAGTGWRSWFSRREPMPLTPAIARRLAAVLLVVTALLLAGHGVYGAFLAKEVLARHYAAIGLGGSDGLWLVRLVGAFELTVAVIVLFYPARWLLVAIVVWKLFTELLHPVSGSSIFETVERGANYAAPLALIILYAWLDRSSRSGEVAAAGVAAEQSPAGSVQQPAVPLTCS